MRARLRRLLVGALVFAWLGGIEGPRALARAAAPASGPASAASTATSVTPPDQAAARVEALTAGWARALGGVEALRGITSVHQLGVVDGHGQSGDLDEWVMVDGRHRQNIDFLGRWNVLTVFDGTRGWSVDAEGVRHVLRGDDLAGEYTDAWLAAFAWAFPGRRPGTLEYGGSAAAGREERLIARPARGLPVTVVFDRAGGLPVRVETPAGDKIRTIALLDWRPVGGVLFPFGYRQSTGDIRDDVSIVLREVRLNETPPPDGFAAPPGPPPDVTFAGEGRARLDVEPALGRIFLPVTIDGRGPFTFLLDTSAPWSTLTPAVAETAALVATLDTTGVALGDAPPAGRRYVTVGALGLGQATWSGARLEVEALDGLALTAARRVDGRLGVDFLTRFVVEFEPGSHRLTLHAPESFEPLPRARVVPLRLVKGLPTLAVRLNGAVEARLLLRTSMRFPLIVSTRFGPALGLLPGAPGTRAAPLMTPAEGAALFTLGRLASLEPRIAGATDAPDLRLAGVPIALPPPDEALPLGPELAGLLGGEVLNRFHWWLDLTREELRLDPEDRVDAPFPEDCAGLTLRAEPPAYDGFTVDWVMPGGPAAAAGLRLGDHLESVNGRPAGEFRLERLIEALSRSGDSVRLTVSAAGKARKVTLRLRPLP